ncbi:MAG: type III pantothenate kinase [Acidiferrobacter sp.]
MTLLLDIGNSRLKWAWRPTTGALCVQSAPYEGADAWPAAWAALAVPGAVWAIASAADRIAAMNAYCARRWQQVPRWFTACADGHGVRNLYRPPEALGADRYAALVGARAHYAAPLCVVDCGTAITVDALDIDGVFRGGAILPGLRSAMAGLHTRVRHLPPADKTTVPDALGLSTPAALAAGSILGTAGAITHLVHQQSRCLNGVTHVLLTGGDAQVLAPHLEFSAKVVEDLTLQGLLVMAT